MKILKNGSICPPVKVNNISFIMTITCAFDALVHLMGNGMDEKEISSERPENNMFFDSIKSYMTCLLYTSPSPRD